MAALAAPRLGVDARPLAWAGGTGWLRLAADLRRATEGPQRATASPGPSGHRADRLGRRLPRPGVARGGAVGGCRAVRGDESGAGGTGAAGRRLPVLGCGVGLMRPRSVGAASAAIVNRHRLPLVGSRLKPLLQVLRRYRSRAARIWASTAAMAVRLTMRREVES